jgi:hypothetical protein
MGDRYRFTWEMDGQYRPARFSTSYEEPGVYVDMGEEGERFVPVAALSLEENERQRLEAHVERLRSVARALHGIAVVGRPSEPLCRCSLAHPVVCLVHLEKFL